MQTQTSIHDEQGNTLHLYREGDHCTFLLLLLVPPYLDPLCVSDTAIIPRTPQTPENKVIFGFKSSFAATDHENFFFEKTVPT